MLERYCWDRKLQLPVVLKVIETCSFPLWGPCKRSCRVTSLAVQLWESVTGPNSYVYVLMGISSVVKPTEEYFKLSGSYHIGK